MLVLTFLTAVSALNCANLGLSDLDLTTTVSKQISAPPTVHRKTVYFNPCGPVKVPSNSPGKCAEDDHLCVIEETQNDGKWVLTGVLPYGSALNGAEEILGDNAAPDAKLGSITYQGAKWGEEYLTMLVNFRCGDSQVLELDEQTLYFTSNAVCISNNNTTKSGWGFFHWVFFFVIVGLIAYVLLVVYVNSAQSPLARDLQQNLAGFARGLLTDLPYLIRELWSRVTGSFRTSRQGYSAL